MRDATRMREVAEIISSFPENFPCVVLSAMGKVRPRLELLLPRWRLQPTTWRQPLFVQVMQQQWLCPSDSSAPAVAQLTTVPCRSEDSSRPVARMHSVLLHQLLPCQLQRMLLQGPMLHRHCGGSASSTALGGIRQSLQRSMQQQRQRQQWRQSLPPTGVQAQRSQIRI